MRKRYFHNGEWVQFRHKQYDYDLLENNKIDSMSLHYPNYSLSAFVKFLDNYDSEIVVLTSKKENQYGHIPDFKNLITIPNLMIKKTTIIYIEDIINSNVWFKQNYYPEENETFFGKDSKIKHIGVLAYRAQGVKYFAFHTTLTADRIPPVLLKLKLSDFVKDECRMKEFIQNYPQKLDTLNEFMNFLDQFNITLKTDQIYSSEYSQFRTFLKHLDFNRFMQEFEKIDHESAQSRYKEFNQFVLKNQKSKSIYYKGIKLISNSKFIDCKFGSLDTDKYIPLMGSSIIEAMLKSMGMFEKYCNDIEKGKLLYT